MDRARGYQVLVQQSAHGDMDHGLRRTRHVVVVVVVVVVRAPCHSTCGAPCNLVQSAPYQLLVMITMVGTITTRQKFC